MSGADAKERGLAARNLTALAHHRVVGNPDTSRPEDAVGNCFPGLDLDVRSLDRRFFPGLVFDFVWEATPPRLQEPHRHGALLMYPDGYGDSDLRPEYLEHVADAQREDLDQKRRALYRRLVGDDGVALQKGVWYLDWVEQDGAPRVGMYNPAGTPLDGSVVWRIVRSLLPGRLKIGLSRRDVAPVGETRVMELEGWRRQFTSPKTGVISNAYQPGELLMGMCSPWQHDFRDCACHYWASNRPDVVHGRSDPEGERIDWMRSDRASAATAKSEGTMEANRPFQMDHFEINRRWQELDMVIGSTEIGDVFVPPPVARQPVLHQTVGELIKDLRGLAALEMTLALEYLYASFSLIPDLARAGDRDHDDVKRDAGRVRQELMTLAVGEMQHLRWANQIIWTLMKRFEDRNDVRAFVPYEPVVQPAEVVPLGPDPARPGRLRTRPRELRPLTDQALQHFIEGEAPSAGVDGQYMRVIASLDELPEQAVSDLRELASLIVADGVEHHRHFLNIQKLMAPYQQGDPQQRPFPRALVPGGDSRAQAAARMFEDITQKLAEGYRLLACNQDGSTVLTAAHGLMKDVLDIGEELATRNLGIPFWAEGPR